MPARQTVPTPEHAKAEVVPALLPAAVRRKERQRQHIIEIATNLYHENGGANGGFDRTTAEAIAQKADISVRTFFRYFATKADVIFLDAQRAQEELRDLLIERLREKPVAVAAVEASMEQLHRFTRDTVNRERLKRSLLSPEFKERLISMIDQEQRMVGATLAEALAGQPRAVETGRGIALLVRSTIWHALDAWARDLTDDPEEASLLKLEEIVPVLGTLAAACRRWHAALPHKTPKVNAAQKRPRKGGPSATQRNGSGQA